MVAKFFTRKRLSQVLITFLGLQLIAPTALALGNNPAPSLGTPTMSPASPYEVETDTTFSYQISNFSGNLNMSASIKDENGDAMKTWNIGNKGNGTWTVDWDGTFDAGNGEPDYGQTYFFEVKGVYGTFPNFSVYGPKEMQFVVADPALTAPTVDTNPYNPTTDTDGLVIETTLSNLYTDEYAHVYVDIFQGNSLVKTMYKAIPTNANGTQSFEWDGKVNGANASDGTYKALVYGTYGNADQSFGTEFVEKEQTFEVVNNAVVPAYTQPTASDKPFDISITNNTNVFKTTLQNAPQNDVEVTGAVIRDDGSKYLLYVVTLMNQGSGEKVFTWDGKDKNTNQLAEPGDYFFQVTGKQGNTQLTSLLVKFEVIDGTQPLPPVQEPTITSLIAKPSTFSPDGDGVDDAAEVSFTLESDKAADVTMTLGSNAPYGANTELYDAAKNAGKVTYVWNGKLPGSNTVLPDGIYPVKVKVSNADGTDEQTINVVLAAENVILDCGFTDVPQNNPELCEAFKFAKDRQIFVGDAGTTKVRPNSVINRAESAAVMKRTFDSIQYYASDNTKLGFVDVDLNAWYMTDGTMRTAVKNGILKGDATGNTVRPGDQVINAEFVTMFVRGIQNHDDQYAILPEVVKAPYLDTPLAQDAMWYVKTANALKKWFGLYNDKQYFYPTEGKTRADVALLIYDAYQAGLNI